MFRRSPHFNNHFFLYKYAPHPFSKSDKIRQANSQVKCILVSNKVNNRKKTVSTPLNGTRKGTQEQKHNSSVQNNVILNIIVRNRYCSR
jgi:hypothetical protein